MRFKKIYIEVTNICNMNCPFCPPHHRKNEYMSLENFKTILEKIKPYTKYIYLHVKGEPLLHPSFDEIVKMAFDEGFFVNVTTNGTLLKDHLEAMKYIRQINISLHATNDENIIKVAKNIKKTYVNFRIWNGYNDSLENNKSLKILEKEFDFDITKKLSCEMQKLNHQNLSSETNFTIKDNFYASIQNEFKWPSINGDILEEKQSLSKGYCHALKDHIAILVDGSVVPCCLDNEGNMALGNIFKESLEDILNSSRSLRIQEGFKNRTCVEELCKNCEYKNRFN